jgi:hypothetical protein
MKSPEDTLGFWRDIASADAKVLGAIFDGGFGREKATTLL